MSRVCPGLCVVGVKGCSCGDEFSGTELRGKGGDRRAPGESGPVRSLSLPVGSLCREFRVFVGSVSRVV